MEAYLGDKTVKKQAWESVTTGASVSHRKQLQSYSRKCLVTLLLVR